MTDQIRVVVADDHPLFVDGVVAALRASGQVAVVGQAADARTIVRLAQEHAPDVALLDVSMPGGGIDAARQIAASCPATRVVMLTASEDFDVVVAAMQAGAAGYALKGTPSRELLRIVRAVAAGEPYVAPSLAFGLLRERAKPRSESPLDSLSSREREVLALVTAGLSNAEIGARLGLAEKTIKHYMTGVLGKLQVASRVEAAVVGHKAGIVPGAGDGEV